MESTSRPQPCSCSYYKEGTDTTGFQQILKSADSGLSIYRYIPGTHDALRKSQSDNGEAFILRNTKNVTNTSETLATAFDQNKITCPRCIKIVKHAQSLVKNVQLIGRQHVVGVCDHCRLKERHHQSCCRCKEIVKKFKASTRLERELQRQNVKKWLTQVQHLLRNTLTDETKGYKSKINARSEISFDKLLSERNKSESKYYTAESRARDGLETNNRRSNTARTSSSLDQFEVGAYVDTEEYLQRIAGPDKHIKDTSKPSFKLPEDKQTAEISKSIFFKLSEDKRIALNYLSERKQKDKRITSFLKIAEEYTEPKPKHKKLGILKHPIKEYILKSSSEQNFLRNDDILKSQRHSEDSLMRVVEKERPLLSELPWLKSASEQDLSRGFSFLFPKEQIEIKNKRHISSSELIKDLQDNLKTKTEEQKRKKEEELKRKREEKEQKKLENEEKIETERKLLVAKQLLLEKEEQMLQEENLRHIKEISQEKRVLEEITSSIGSEKIAEREAQQNSLKDQKITEKEEQTQHLKIRKEEKLQTQKIEGQEKLQNDKAEKNIKQKIEGQDGSKKEKDSIKPGNISKDKEAIRKEKEIAAQKLAEREAQKTLKDQQKKDKEEKALKAKNEKLNEQEKLKREKAEKLHNEKLKGQEASKNEKEDRLQKQDENTNKSGNKDNNEKNDKSNKKDSPKNNAELSTNVNKVIEEKLNDKSNKKGSPKNNAELSTNVNKVKEEKQTDSAGNEALKSLLAMQEKDKAERAQLKKQQEMEKELAEKKAKEAETMTKAGENKKVKEPESKLKSKEGKDACEKPEKSLTKKPGSLTTKDLSFKNLQVRKPSCDDLILRLVQLKQSEPRKEKNKLSEMNFSPLVIKRHARHKCRDTKCPVCTDSELVLDYDEYMIPDTQKTDEITDIIIGEKIFKKTKLFMKQEEEEKEPPVEFIEFEGVKAPDIVQETAQSTVPIPIKPIKGKNDLFDPEASKGVIRYALSDRAFIDKGWTMLPTEKVVRKMNVYRMRPAHPEFDWFEHNKYKRVMQYDTGEKLAEFDDNGRGRWFYRSGKLALDYYDAEEINAQQRFVVYSSGELDERGRTRPRTILATFDYLGNGIVFDHAGKIRLKYNQTEGVVLDRSIGPVSQWKWHTLNDPPVLQQVMIDTQMPYKDPTIMKLGGPGSGKKRVDNEEMLAIEFDNFIKEKSRKLTQKFKPFQIKMKALKINEYFSLRVLDQATVYLLFRDGTTNLKINMGMVLDHKEIVDTDTADVGDVSNSMERFPARTDSLAVLQQAVAQAQREERTRVRHERRLHKPAEPCASADRLTAAASRPLRPPLGTASSGTTLGSKQCPCKFRKPSSNLYYDTRL